MEKNNETLSILRHSTSHIMAQAVQSLFPSAKLAIGPATADGFYYDFDLTDGHAFTEEDLTKIEEKMKEIIKQNGNPVIGSDHYSVMDNYQKMEQFLKSAEQEEKGSVILYEADTDGGITRKEYSYDGKW